jgi:gamma-glutamylcyclotransferase (GGCT)/AIG2-like uncharacterized protein YtfP
MTTLTVELTLDQILGAIRRLPEQERLELLDALEDYFLGKHIEATEDEKLIGRDEAIRYLAEGH